MQLHHSSASLSSPLFEFVPSQVLLFLRFPSKLLGCKGPPQSLFLREFDLKFEVSVYLLYNLHCARCLNFTVINRKQVIINCDKYYNRVLSWKYLKMEKTPTATAWGMREAEQGRGELLCTFKELGKCFIV